MSDQFVIVGAPDLPTPSAPVMDTVPQERAEAAGGSNLGLRCVPAFSQMHQLACSLTGMLEVSAPASAEPAADTTRAPVEICAVIDRSGSMRVKKLALVLEALTFVVRELLPQDKLSIVTYDHSVALALPHCMMTTENKKKALTVLKTIKPGGSTNLSGGLLAGMQELRKHPVHESKMVTRSVWLFTDGQATDGIRSTDGIVGAVNDFLSDSTDMTLYTFGFGDTHNEEMLRAVAEIGSGMYYYLRTPDDIPPCFAECLGGLLSVAAADIVATFTPADGVRVQQSGDQSGVEVRDNTVVVKYKDLFAEECRNAVFDLLLPPCENEGPQVVGSTTLAWRGTDGQHHTKEASLRVERVREYAAERVEDPMVKLHGARVRVAQSMQKTKLLAEAGNLAEARRVMDEVVAVNEAQARCREADDLDDCADLYDDFAEDARAIREALKSQQSWQATGKKSLANKQMQHCKQRAAYCAEAAPRQARFSSERELQDKADTRRESKLTSLPPPMAMSKKKKAYSSSAQQSMMSKFAAAVGKK